MSREYFVGIWENSQAQLVYYIQDTNNPKCPQHQVNFYKNGDLIDNNKIADGDCDIYNYFTKHHLVKHTDQQDGKKFDLKK